MYEEFCKKQGLFFDWQNKNVVCFGDYYFSPADIEYDLKSNQPAGKIIEYFYFCVEGEIRNLSYKDYCLTR